MNAPLFPQVSVNGEIITPVEIAAEAQNHTAPPGKPGIAWRAATQALIIRALLLQEARRDGIAPEPQIIGGGKRETDEEALIRAVLEDRIEVREVTESACRATYDKHPDKFRSPVLFEASHILFPAAPGDDEARKEAGNLALAAIAEITRNPGDFGRIARESSACPSRDNGGSLGQLSGGDTVAEFEAALNRMEPGELHPTPVETPYGVHVIRLDARAEGKTLPYSAVKRQISERLEQRAWAVAARAYTTRLVADAEIITGEDRRKTG